MTSSFPGDVRDAAAQWTIRLKDPGFADWDAFTRWLEADPRHAAAYDLTVLAEQEAANWMQTAGGGVRVAETEEPAPPRRRVLRWVGGSAVAAVLAGVVGFATLRDAHPPRAIETAPGTRQQIALADGSRIDINGASRLLLDDDRPREVKLERGEALFTIRHDPRQPFVVEAGGARLVDVGTVFNVVRDGRGMRLAVSEGAVVFNPGRENVRVDAGEALQAPAGSEAVTLGRIDPSAVGGWTAGRLDYTGATVEAVAADLQRNLGVPVRAEAGAGPMPFTGTISLEGEADAVIARAASLMGVQAVPSDHGWKLLPGDRARP